MTIWLTGCTAGLGRALIGEFLEAGHTLIGCGRNEIALAHLKEKFPEGHFFAVDVANDFSVSEFCEEALAIAGAPDLVTPPLILMAWPMSSAMRSPPCWQKKKG